MARRRSFVLLATVLIHGFTGASAALALASNAVDRAQRATVLVDVNTSEGRAFGTAFCVGDAGLFATDGHVVLQNTGPVKLVIRAGEKDQRVVTGRVLGIDYDADLALIQADNPGNTIKLMLGNSEAVQPTQEITAFGFPFGNMLALDKDSYPSITVNSGKVTAMRKEKGELALIQVDALVNPGNSGGPVLDSEGRVIGLVESGVPGAGLNFVTPVAKLKKMMSGPLVVLEPTTVDYAVRNKRQTFSIRVSSISHAVGEFDVQLDVTDPKGAVQSASGKTTGGKCDLILAPTTGNAPIEWNPFEEATPAFKFALTLKQSNGTVGVEHGLIYLDNIPLPGGGFVRGGPRHGGRKERPHNSGWPKEVRTDPLPPDAIETSLLGVEKGDQFREVNSSGELAIGVQYASGEASGKPAIANMRLLYGKHVADKDPSFMAKEGYVVGGLNIGIGQYSSGRVINGFQVIFIRQKDGRLDTADTYTSDWAGNTPSAGKQKRLAGDGSRVIGLCGRKAAVLRAIGLVIEKTATAPATQPARK